MSVTQHSTRFTPNTINEKIVSALLVILLVALLAVFVIVGLSLIGGIPSA